MEIITNIFPKQPRETRRYTVSFAEALEANGDTLRASAPFEMGAVPDGITVDSAVFDPVLARLTLTLSGGTHHTSYLLEMWVHTEEGQKLEHQVTAKVVELTR